MNTERPPVASFADLLKQRQWSTYEDFISEAPGVYAAEMQRDTKRK